MEKRLRDLEAHTAQLPSRISASAGQRLIYRANDFASLPTVAAQIQPVFGYTLDTKELWLCIDDDWIKIAVVYGSEDASANNKDFAVVSNILEAKLGGSWLKISHMAAS